MSDPDAPLLLLTARWPAPSETFILRDLLALRRAGMPFQLVAIHGRPNCVVDGIAAEVLNESDGEGSAGQGRFFGGPRWLKDGSRGLRHQATVRRLRDFVAARGIRHLHALHLDLPGWLVAQVARASNRTFSLEGHARDVHCSHYGLAAICRGATHVTVCNEAARSALAARLGDGPTPILLHHGIAVDSPPRRAVIGESVRIAFVGRFVPKKGAFEAIEIARLFAATDDRRIQLTLIGDGPQAGALRTAAGRASAVACHFTGWLSPASVIDHLRNEADLLLLPARTADDGDRDGIPNVVLEAMAQELPVVAATAGGIAEVLSDVTGWPFPEGQLECAVEALQSLLANSAAARQRSVAAHQLLRDAFDPATIAARRVRLFQQALAHSAR